jgi:membrane-bound lytic murein transglycosylase B
VSLPARARLAPVLLVLGLLAGACAERADGLPEALARSTSTSSRPTSTTTSTAPTSTTAAPTTTTAPFDVFALRPPPPPGDALAVATQINQAETVLRWPEAPPEAVGAAALAQQVAYRQLGLHPEWDAAVLAAVPAELHDVVAHHAAARREFRAMHRTLSTTLPAWRIVPPAPLPELEAIYHEAGGAFGVPWQTLAAINLVETGMGRIRGTSVAGAQGPMQFLPSTWAAYGAGGDINDVRDSIFGAARYLAANGGGADLRNALWNYNHSDHYVQGVLAYSNVLAGHPTALRALYHWGVFYLTADGDVYLPVGYEQAAPTPIP